MARTGGHNSGDENAGITILGVPLFSAILKMLAILAGLIAYLQTVQGLRVGVFGIDSLTGIPASFAGGLIVQGGLIAVSLYVAKRFVSSRLGTSGRRSGDGSIVGLSILVLAILFTFSVFFTFSGNLSNSTQKQEHDDRVRIATETANDVQQSIKRAAEDEMRRITTLIKAGDTYKSWEATNGQLIALGSQPDVPALVEKFVEDNKRNVQLYQIAIDKRKGDIAAALLPVNADIATKKATQKRLEDERSKIDDAELDDLQQLVDAERDGRVVTIRGIKTTGRPGCSTECNARQNAVNAARARIQALAQQLRKVNEELADLERRKVAIERGQLGGAQAPAQAPPPAAPKAAGAKQRQTGQQPAQPPAQQPGQQTPTGEIVAPPNAELVAKLVVDKNYVSNLTSHLQANIAQLSDIYRDDVFQDTIKSCGELKEYLLLINKGQDQRVRAVSCDVANLGEHVGNVNAFAQVQVAAKPVCEKLPQAPAILGRDSDEKRKLSLEYVEQVKVYAQNCQAAAGLAQRGDVTKPGRAKVETLVKSMEDSYGEGANYLTRSVSHLVRGEPQAIRSMGLALGLDSLILVLAFLSELPTVRLDNSGPKPLSETERRKLAALIKFAHADDDPRFRAERLLVDHLKPDAKTSNFVIDLGNVDARDEKNLLRGLLNSQMGGDESLVWATGKDRFAVTPRGYFELLRGMDEGARQRHESRAAGDYGDVAPTRQVVPDSTDRTPARGGRAGGAGGYDYSKLFADKSSGGEDAGGDVPDYLKPQEPQRGANGASNGPRGLRPVPGGPSDPKDRNRR